MEPQRNILRSQRTLSKQEEVSGATDLDCRLNTESCSGPEIDSSSQDRKFNEDNQQCRPPNNVTTVNSNNTTSTTSEANNNSYCQMPNMHRLRSQSKVKLLVRSHAVREEASPPPEAIGSVSTHSDSDDPEPPTRHTTNIIQKMRRHSSATEETCCWSEPSLSRGNSREQCDSGNNPIDLQQFIADTLNRNYKDRMLLFKIENELINLSKDSKRNSHKFGQMSSYQRMLVHRVAAYFGMEHNVDTTGMSVIVNTTKNTRVPDHRFRDFVREDLLEEPRKSILKRDSSSFDEACSFKNGDRMWDSRRSKSFEEREQEYKKVKRRIFNHEHLTDTEIDCMKKYNWESMEGDDDSCCPRCASWQQTSIERNNRLLKIESYESGDTLKANSLRLQVSKSHSFNGYDQGSNQQTRLLLKQDSGSSMTSRISPSSSGYKSQRSDATLSATPSPSGTPSLQTQLSGGGRSSLSPEPDCSSQQQQTHQQQVVWAVTDMASVPPGSMLIHPQTGQPYTNADGSIYRYDPENPPVVSGGPEVSIVASTASPLCSTDIKPDIEAVGASNQTGKGLMGRTGRFEMQSGTSSQQLNHPIPSGITQGPPTSSSIPYQVYPLPMHQLPPPPQIIPPPPPGDQFHAVQPNPGQPLLYQPPIPNAHHCDPRIQDYSLVNGDLSACMMGMSLDTRPERHPVFYWQPPHIQSGVTMYYSHQQQQQAALSGTLGNSRYTHQATPVPPVPPTASTTTATAFTIFHHPTPTASTLDHNGTCFGNTSGANSAYSNTGSAECLPPYPFSVQMYPPHCNGGGQQTASVAAAVAAHTQQDQVLGSGATQQGLAVPCSGYYTSVASCSPAQSGIPPSYQQLCSHPTPSHMPQLAVYNGCYPGSSTNVHYGSVGHNNAAANISGVPQLFRKPSLQAGVRCSSPLKGKSYPVSPSLKERPALEESKAPSTVLQQNMQPKAAGAAAAAIYGITVLPGEENDNDPDKYFLL